jgi:predicted RNA binding protein YcfA (HicA-like mRNA interferase family)
VSKLSAVPAQRVLKALQKAGFEVTRRKGSHVFLSHPDGRATVIPVHKGEDLGRGLLRKIIRDAELTREEFISILKEV